MAMYAPSAPESIIVTAMRREQTLQDAPMAVSVVTASEENLGDLKLFRVPGRVDVSAKGMKQVAFLNKDAVKARYLYQARCEADDLIDPELDDPAATSLLLVTKNEDKQGLGIALPQGSLTVYEPTSGSIGRGPQVGAQTSLRDYARGQDVELELGASAQVFAICGNYTRDGRASSLAKWAPMRAVLTNANPHPVRVRLQLGWAGGYDIRFPGHKVAVKNGWQTVEVTVPANATASFDWKAREGKGE
jgi:hypothetical protein